MPFLSSTQYPIAGGASCAKKRRGLSTSIILLICSTIPPLVSQEHSPLFPLGCDRGGCA